MKRILILEREYGSGGSEIAALAARRLGWKLLDQALTEEIARLAQVSTEVCKQREEQPDTWSYKLAKIFWYGSHERGTVFKPAGFLDAERFVHFAQEVVTREAQKGHCVLVGRGAPYLLRERTDTLCVFLYAPRSFKFQRVLSEVKDEALAIELVDTADEVRAEFLRHYAGERLSWPHRPFYHAMLNTAAGEEATVDTIIYLLEKANRREGGGGSA